MTVNFASRLRRTLRPGMTVALGDGVGGLRTLDDGTSILAEISRAATEVDEVTLILGWSPLPLVDLRPDGFARVITLMPGWGARALTASAVTRSIPTSMSAIPALVAGPLRPDLLITRMVARSGKLSLSTEVSWQQGLIAAGVPVWAVVDGCAPAASAVHGGVASADIDVVGLCSDGPTPMPGRAPEPVHEALADNVLRLVPPGARLQYGPGQLGTAILQRAEIPLAIDTGLLTDAVVDLDRRGLLVGVPSATYLFGGAELFAWADGREILHGIEHTHDVTRLATGGPFVSVNTAIEIDPYGQVNVEGIGDRVVGGIGGHPDYCTAGRLSPGGLSIIAVTSRFGGRSPLVERLSRPASTPAHDVDVIVTERGHVDLRDADWVQRRALLTELFDR